MHSGSQTSQAFAGRIGGDDNAVPRDGDWRTGIGGLAMVVAALTVARLVAAALIPITPDETYYWFWSRFPSFGYFDHPPMVAWWIWLSTALFGNSTFGVRALSILAVLPLSAAVYATGVALFDRPIARRAVLWTNASLLLGVGGILATPDMPSLLFWTLAILALALLLRTQNAIWWLAIGLFAGLGVQSKFTDLFLGLGLVVALLAFRDLRRWLVTPWPWLGGVVAGLVVLPLLIWNAGHGWVTFSKQFGRVVGAGLDVVGVLEYVGTQFLLLNPFVSIFVVVALAVWVGRRRETGGIAILMTTALPLILYFFVHALHGRVQGNWPAPVYPTLALVAAAATTAIPGTGASRRFFAWCRDFAFPFGVVASLIGLFALSAPFITLPKNIADQFYGWRGLAEEVEAAADGVGAGWIGTTSYSFANELRFHLRDQSRPVLQIVQRVRYVFAPLPDPALIEGPGLIFGKEDSETLAACFAEITQLPDVTRQADGQRSYRAYLVRGADPDLLASGCRLR